MDGSKKIFAFDFDGTLTTADTLLEFVSFARGRRALALWMLANLPLLALMKLRLVSNHKMKERLFGHFFAGTDVAGFDALCRRFATERHSLLRPIGVAAVARAVESGARVLVVSASVDNWVAPFFCGFGGRVTVVGTRAEARDGVLTGRFATRNCYGAEKVRRIMELCPDRAECRLTAYGDSRGDREMLAFADEAHYKPFR